MEEDKDQQGQKKQRLSVRLNAGPADSAPGRAEAPALEKETEEDRRERGRNKAAELPDQSRRGTAGPVPSLNTPGQPDPTEQLNAVYGLTLKLTQQMEKSRIAQYTELLHSPWRLIWLNVLSGAARGVGIAVGFTFFAATIIYVLQGLGALNLPIIGDYIADIVRIVQHQLELKTF